MPNTEGLTPEQLRYEMTIRRWRRFFSVFAVLLVIGLGYGAYWMDQLHNDTLTNRRINCENQERTYAVVQGKVTLSHDCSALLAK